MTDEGLLFFTLLSLLFSSFSNFFSLSCVFLGFHLYILLFRLSSLMKKKNLQSSSLPWEQSDNWNSKQHPGIHGNRWGRAAGLGKLQGMFEIQNFLLYSVTVLRALLVQKEFTSSPWVYKLPTDSHFHDCSMDAMVAAAFGLQEILPSISLFILSIQGLHECPSLQIWICCFVILTFRFIDVWFFSLIKPRFYFLINFHSFSTVKSASHGKLRGWFCGG